MAKSITPLPPIELELIQIEPKWDDTPIQPPPISPPDLGPIPVPTYEEYQEAIKEMQNQAPDSNNLGDGNDSEQPQNLKQEK